MVRSINRNVRVVPVNQRTRNAQRKLQGKVNVVLVLVASVGVAFLINLLEPSSYSVKIGEAIESVGTKIVSAKVPNNERIASANAKTGNSALMGKADDKTVSKLPPVNSPQKMPNIPEVAKMPTPQPPKPIPQSPQPEKSQLPSTKPTTPKQGNVVPLPVQPKQQMIPVNASTGGKLRQQIVSLFQYYNRGVTTERANHYAGLVISISDRYNKQMGINIDPLLVASIIVVESTVKPAASSKGNYGMMQVNWTVHKHRMSSKFGINTHQALFIPENGILAGIEVYAGYLQRWKTERTALIRYCGGSGAYATKVLGVREVGKKLK